MDSNHPRNNDASSNSAEKPNKNDPLSSSKDENLDASKTEDSFFCSKCGKEMNFKDQPKFCINCGNPFVLNVHGKVLVTDTNQSLPKPTPSSNQNITINLANTAYASGINMDAPYIQAPSMMYYGQPGWKKQRKWNVLAGILMPLVVFIGITLVSGILVAIITIMNGGFVSFDSLSFLISSFSIFFFIIPVLWVQRYYHGKLSFKQRIAELGLDLDKYSRVELIREIILGIFLGFFGVILIFGLQALGAFLVELLFNINVDVLLQSDSLSDFEILDPETLGELLLYVGTMVFFVGVPEEVMFRGFVQRSFESKLNKPAALLLTALYFAIYHIFIYILNPPVFFYLSISYIGLSIYLGLIRNWRKDIIAASIMHMVYNSTQMIIVFIILH